MTGDAGAKGASGHGGNVAAGAEARRLAEARRGEADWKRWGPYVSARQWGTVREDYSADGDAWRAFPFDHARSRAYRWGEDGLAAVCDRWQHLCLGIALWNERDPFLKERLFGLTNEEGNHGEDAKELWWHVDATPTSSWLRWRYKYPQCEFPYETLRAVHRGRSRLEPEVELADLGVFDGDRYFDVEVSYAKADPNDLCMEVAVTNRGPDRAPLHVLPTVWFRNTWSWGRDRRHPHLRVDEDGRIALEHGTLGRFWFESDDAAARPTLLVTDNETNSMALWGVPNRGGFCKDGIDDHVVRGAATVNPAREGTKAASWYRLDVDAGATVVVRSRLRDDPAGAAFGPGFADVVRRRREEADAFHDALVPETASADAKAIQRQAVAGLLWTKKYYSFHVADWLDGDPAFPPPPAERRTGRNADWAHLANTDIVSLPDEWEYPWYAAWDLAFHMVPMAFVDPDFAKEQMILLCREWYMHPNGQLPAYEWNFGDVNPPVHAWAVWRVYKIDARRSGVEDRVFLARAFHKLLINFTWWVNRKDRNGRNVFEGGFLGLDNIGLFDRSKGLPGGGHLEQADGTSWMAMYCLNMLAIALELAADDPSYEDVATKFFEHFLYIANAMNGGVGDGMRLWDDDDGFFYDVLHVHGRAVPLKVRSVVGVIPLFAAETLEPDVLQRLPDFSARVRWFVRHRPELCANVFTTVDVDEGERRLLSLVSPGRLTRILRRVLDPDEFLSPHGLRSVSKAHEAAPAALDLDGVRHEVRYEPGESPTGMFGGNSNWRGPVWFPITYLLVESLQRFHHFLGETWTVEHPTGSGERHDLAAVADDISHRLISIFLRDGDGRRPANGGDDRLDHDPHWRDLVTFWEYFHGDTGAGLGAAHQTGWTALVAKLIRSGTA